MGTAIALRGFRYPQEHLTPGAEDKVYYPGAAVPLRPEFVEKYNKGYAGGTGIVGTQMDYLRRLRDVQAREAAVRAEIEDTEPKTTTLAELDELRG